jgi:hypothetical protein
MALLSTLDLSVLHSREDGEEAVQNLPVLSDPEYINAVINELLPTKQKWKCEGLQATATFGLAVCIASLRLIPQNQLFQEAISKEELSLMPQSKATFLSFFTILCSKMTFCTKRRLCTKGCTTS